ncbi:MAG: hypothetical protein D6731_15910 [Planctomycetota bacterium]|nr:MAG: hypothetical protein D6731_15910 [Planctomycetota bacterium]
MASPFEDVLEPGERLVWQAPPGPPRWLRALGVPPRRPLHVFALTGLAVACAAAALAAGEASAAGLRAALGALALGPPAMVVAGFAWARRRARRWRYGATDRGRGLWLRDESLLAFPLAPLPTAEEGEQGDLLLGRRPVRVLRGPGAGADSERDLRLVDVPYPRAALEALRHAVEPVDPPR